MQICRRDDTTLQKCKKFLLIIAIVSTSSCQLKQENPRSLYFENSTATAVIGGETAATNEFPFIINIWLNSPKENYFEHLCGASLIYKKWVLTAAHCLLQEVTDKSLGVINVRDLLLFIGSNKISGQGGRSLNAKAIFIHPQYSWPKFDVALIELTNPVEDISPVLLNKHPFVDFKEGALATAAGWGLIDEQGKVDANLLQKVTLPLVTRALCSKDSTVHKRGWLVEADMICAQTQFGKKATCAGDSGGPLLQNLGDRFLQIGVVSWGFACRLTYLNNPSNIEGYSDVSASYAWIQSRIEAR